MHSKTRSREIGPEFFGLKVANSTHTDSRFLAFLTILRPSSQPHHLSTPDLTANLPRAGYCFIIMAVSSSFHLSPTLPLNRLLALPALPSSLLLPFDVTQTKSAEKSNLQCKEATTSSILYYRYLRRHRTNQDRAWTSGRERNSLLNSA